MLDLGVLRGEGSRIRRVLCLGAHADDLEIGAGGTVLRLLDSTPGLIVRWVVFSARGDRRAEAQAGAERLLAAAGSSQIQLENFRDGYFPFVGADIKDCFERIKREFDPDVVFTHYRSDRHQDHRAVSDLTWNTFRDHLILEYEIPKYDGDLGSPNLFVPIPTETRERKLNAVLETFRSQRERAWFSAETFDALMRLRGIECNAESGFAEAFYVRKAVWRM